jgi:hypothetical protein
MLVPEVARLPTSLSGGLFKCGRCGANMVGFHTASGYYYICGSQPYRKGMGCGPGVYVPQHQVETEVLHGLRDLVALGTDAKAVTRAVNEQLREMWAAATNFRRDMSDKISAIDQKIANIRQAVEDGLQDAKWANARLRELLTEREALTEDSSAGGPPPQIDSKTILQYSVQTEKLFRVGDLVERKRLLRIWVEEVKLMPHELEVRISYRLPEAVMNGVVAGEGFEPSTFGL